MRLALLTLVAVLAIASPAFATSVTNVTVDNTAPSSAAGARTVYAIGLTTSAAGALPAHTGRIDVTFPAGTTFDGLPDDGVAGFECSRTGLTLQCVAVGGVGASASATLTFRGIGNGPAGAGKTVTVSTTADTDPVVSAPFGVVAGGSIRQPSVSIDYLDGVHPEYNVRFGTSSTGALSERANSRIYLTFPPEADLSHVSGDVHTTVSDYAGYCRPLGGPLAECGFDMFRGSYTDGAFEIVLHGVPNVPGPGPYQIKVSTTSDLPVVTSSDFFPGVPIPPDTTILGTSPTIAGSKATFAFGAVYYSGTFECRVDGEPFVACSSPYTTADLPAGVHTFEVRSITYAGLADPTPATSTFTIAGAQTSPVPAPTPTPAPDFKKDVLVKPVSGKVEVCAKPGKNCLMLITGTEVALGATIDARKGVVELRAATAKGAVQVAKFSGGVFKVTQSATTTDLTLNESLGACAKHKTRRLRGEGAGAFRIRGRFGTATGGTNWLVEDSCRATVVRASHGTVSVRDAVKRKTVTLRAGKRYTARRG